MSHYGDLQSLPSNKPGGNHLVVEAVNLVQRDRRVGIAFRQFSLSLSQFPLQRLDLQTTGRAIGRRATQKGAGDDQVN